MRERFNKVWDEVHFHRLFLKALGVMPLHLHFLNFIAERLIQSRQRPEGQRMFQLSLALSWVHGLGGILLLMIFCALSSWWGYWTFLWSPASRVEPPLWILLLGDSGYHAMILPALIVGVPAAIFGYGGAAWVWGLTGLFAGVISFPVFWSVVFLERVILLLRSLTMSRDSLFRQDLVIRTGLALGFWLLVLTTGPDLREILRSLGLTTTGPFDRWFLALVGWTIFAALETSLACAVFHFVAQKNVQQPPAIWDLRMFWIRGPWDRRLDLEIYERAKTRWAEIQKWDQEMSPEDRKRVPASLILKIQREKQELLTFRARVGLHD